jgi:glutamine amidotransferase
MQLLFDSSEEGHKSGLSLIKGTVKKFYNIDSPCIPNMGWRSIEFKKDELLFKDDFTRFYFVHSYYASCEQPSDIWITSKNGIEYAAAVKSENIFGVQFHPEKSHIYGKTLLKHLIHL